MNSLKTGQIVNVISSSPVVVRNNAEVKASTLDWVVISIPESVNLKVSLRPVQDGNYNWDDAENKVFWFSRACLKPKPKTT